MLNSWHVVIPTLGLQPTHGLKFPIEDVPTGQMPSSKEVFIHLLGELIDPLVLAIDIQCTGEAIRGFQAELGRQPIGHGIPQHAFGFRINEVQATVFTINGLSPAQFHPPGFLGHGPMAWPVAAKTGLYLVNAPPELERSRLIVPPACREIACQTFKALAGYIQIEVGKLGRGCVGIFARL